MKEFRIRIEDDIPNGIAFQMALNIIYIANLKETTSEQLNMIYSDGTRCTVKLTDEDNIKTISVCKTRLKTTE